MSAQMVDVDTKVIITAIKDRIAQLDIIKALTKKMLYLVKQQRWDDVSKLEAERGDLIYSFFEVTPSVEEVEYVASTILEVLATDKKIIMLSLSEQQNILRNSQKISRGKQASQAYNSSNK